MPYMSSLTGKTEEELASDLRGVIYMDFNRKPDGSYTWRTADDFLSGNVREKLAYYQKALDIWKKEADIDPFDISTSYSFPVTDFCFDGQCGFFCLPKLQP